MCVERERERRGMGEGVDKDNKAENWNNMW